MRICIIVFTSLWLLTGCANRLLLAEQDLSQSKQLIQFQHYSNPAYHCGPATLAGLMDFYQLAVDFEQLSEQLILPGKGGTLQLDMDRVARQQGLVPYPLTEFEQLFFWLDQGVPVLLFENLGLSWAPRWHYSLLRGYDLERQEAILSSGNHPYLRVSFNTLNNTWQRGGSWARVLLPPEHPAPSIGLREQLRQGQNLLSTGQTQAAVRLFERLAAQDQPLALIALGNHHYQQQEWELSQARYQQALALLPLNASLWFNYGQSLAHQCPVAAEQALSCSQALGLTESAPQTTAPEPSLPVLNDPPSCPLIHCPVNPAAQIAAPARTQAPPPAH